MQTSEIKASIQTLKGIRYESETGAIVEGELEIIQLKNGGFWVREGGNTVIRGVTNAQFFETVADFANGKNEIIANQAWSLWKDEKWSDLERLFKSNNINVYNGIIFPPNNGAVSVLKRTLDPKDFKGHLIIDRYGSTSGKFTSPANTPFEKRALPNSYLSLKPQQYKVLKPITNVEEGQIIPWFGQPGLGVQYKLEKSVQYYIDEGYLQLLP
ncbi:MAG: TNT domain-containing protein [Bacteroidetes bacterium]|nr:TNT domain-containing protein [Bacteroidota bacterium]